MRGRRAMERPPPLARRRLECASSKGKSCTSDHLEPRDRSRACLSAAMPETQTIKPDSRRVLTLFVLAVMPLVVGSCQEQTLLEPEDTSLVPLQGNRAIAFYSGNVITMNPVTRVEEAVLVRGSSIVATGSSDQIRGMAAPNGVEVDLEGRTLMPGFVDPHNHAFNAVFSGRRPEIVGTTYGEAQQRLLEAGTTTIGNSLGAGSARGVPTVCGVRRTARTNQLLSCVQRPLRRSAA